MFFNPKLEAEIGPATSMLNPQNQPLFKRIGMEEYVKEYFFSQKLNGKSYLEKMRIKSDQEDSTTAWWQKGFVAILCCGVAIKSCD